MTRELRLGAFIVAALLMLGCGVFLIGNRESLFKRTYLIKAEFPNVGGLNAGADVRVGGIREGTVKRVELPSRPGGAVTVVANLDRATHNILKADSIAAIKSDGLLGDKYVEVSFGSEEAAPLKDGDTIQSSPPFDISDLISKTNQILDSANVAARNAQALTGNLKSVSSKIDEGQGTLGALINDRTIYDKATASVTSLQEDMEAFKHNFLLRGFFKNRGYNDAADLTKHAVSKLPDGEPSKVFVFDSKKLFDKPDSAKLKNEKALNPVGAYLEQAKFGSAVVAASSGMVGDTDKDRQLTEAQSMVVRNYLANHFHMDDTRVKTLGLGKAETEGDSNKTEILIYAEAQPAARKSDSSGK